MGNKGASSKKSGAGGAKTQEPESYREQFTKQLAESSINNYKTWINQKQQDIKDAQKRLKKAKTPEEQKDIRQFILDQKDTIKKYQKGIKDLKTKFNLK